MANEKTATLPALLQRDSYKKPFFELLNQDAPRFIANLNTIYMQNDLLKKCDPLSILSAAKLAASLDLSISPTLGYAYIVPYGDKAQFQISAKGLIQLAHRTGQYLRINKGAIREGEIKFIDPITGEYEVGARTSDKVVGYAAYFELKNGFRAMLYMTKEDVENHAQAYSKAFQLDKKSGRKSSPWSTNFDAMAEKTVLKKLLRDYGLVSTLIEKALQSDQAAISPNDISYIDSPDDNIAQVETIEVKDPPAEGQPSEIVDAETGEVRVTGDTAS